MWWRELDSRLPPCGACSERSCLHVDETAVVAPDAVLDSSGGPILIGARTRIGKGVILRGPVAIGADCLVGDYVTIRGSATIGASSRIGLAAEIKNSIIGERVSIGPQCFVGDSKIEHDAYLGAQVRTSNHRLDQRTVQVAVDGKLVDSGREKLGCLIGARAALGIQVIILPGRIVPPDCVIGPRITIEKNLPTGRYRLLQHLVTY